MKFGLFALFTGLLTPTIAHSGQTEWFETEGGNVRLVVAPVEAGSKNLRGFIDIGLLPGWKTYWRNPGSGGIPPVIEVDGGSTANISYPTPVWIDTEYGSYAGYDKPVKLPFDIDLTNFEMGESITVRMMVGICEDICIPAFTNFSLPVEEASGSDQHTIAVAGAIAQLPKPAQVFGAEISTILTDSEGVEFSIPNSINMQSLFVAGSGDVQFGKPQITAQSASGTAYRAQVLRPVQSLTPITLYINGQAANGTFELQQKLSIPPAE